MLWKENSIQKIYIPNLTKNKEIKLWIKKLCVSRLTMSDVITAHRFDVFPEHPHHYIVAILYDMFDNRVVPHKEWKEMEISHFINGVHVDAIASKVKSNGSIYFEYTRSFTSTINPILDNEDIFFLDSSKIDWNSFAKQLKLWCIEIV